MYFGSKISNSYMTAFVSRYAVFLFKMVLCTEILVLL